MGGHCAPGTGLNAEDTHPSMMSLKCSWPWTDLVGPSNVIMDQSPHPPTATREGYSQIISD